MLSNRLWTRNFGANRDLLGKPIRMNGEPYTVIGILPPGIHDRFNSQFWVPLTILSNQTNRDQRSVLVMGRLKDGVSLAQAQSEMKGIGEQIQRENPTPN